MRNLRVLKRILVLLLCVAAVTICRAESGKFSTLQTVVLDDTGEYVQDAELFLFAKSRNEYIVVHYSSATARVNLPAGTYRVYAAMTQSTDGIYDHYISPEAELTLESGENASVILALQKTVQHEMIISDTTRAKLNIDAELAKYLN